MSLHCFYYTSEHPKSLHSTISRNSFNKENLSCHISRKIPVSAYQAHTAISLLPNIKNSVLLNEQQLVNYTLGF